jgi:hypothetical protein
MLGFNSFAESAHGDPLTFVIPQAASITLVGVSAASSISNVTSTLSAALNLTGVESSLAFGTAADAFDADANITLASATATGTAADIAEVHLTASKQLDAVTISATLDSLSVFVGAGVALDSVAASTSIEDVIAKGGADVNIDDVSVASTNSDLSIELTASVDISGVSSTLAFGTAADAFDADANTTLESTSVVTTINGFDSVKGAASTELDTTSSTVSLTEITLSVAASVNVDSVAAILEKNLDTPTAVQFNYDPDDYDKSRVVYLLPQDENTTVHIIPESTTIYVDSLVENNVVYINPENRTVVIDRVPNNNLVYIAA